MKSILTTNHGSFSIIVTAMISFYSNAQYKNNKVNHEIFLIVMSSLYYWRSAKINKDIKINRNQQGYPRKIYCDAILLT